SMYLFQAAVHTPQPPATQLVFWESLLFFPKLPRVDDAAMALALHRILDVQHLMKHEVFDEVARGPGRIQQPADGDGVVRRIVVTEEGPGKLRAPPQAHAGAVAFEDAAVQALDSVCHVD